MRCHCLYLPSVPLTSCDIFRFNFGRARKDAKHIDYHPTVEQRQRLDPSYKPRVIKSV